MNKFLKILTYFGLLSALFFISAIGVSAATGCWDYGGNQTGCESTSDSLNCLWYDAGQDWCPSGGSGCCEQKGCWLYDGDKTTCEAATSLGCTWEDNQYNQEMWCSVSASNPYTSNGTLVSGTDLGCCSQPGCWDRDGTNSTYCQDSSFIDGICNWKTQAQDPYCPDSNGCCMMPFCNDASNKTECDVLASKGQPCSWSGSACSDPGFSGFNGADSCISNGGVWNGTDCAMPTYGGAADVHCWFADYQPSICGNITGCVYCNSSKVLESNSACYNNQIGWCQGHESFAGAVDINQSSMTCGDIQLNSICDCGPVPGCHWTNSSAVTGSFCSAGVSQCNLNYEDLTFDQCEDALNQTDCDMLKNTYFMPCKWDNKSTTYTTDDECGFDWQSGGGFGDNKGSSDFEFGDIMDSNTCSFAGGIWKTVEIDTYGNTQGWCEFGFGAGMETCNESCWACEFQDNGQPWASLTAAQGACGNSSAGGGDCSFISFGSQQSDNRWGWCDYPQEMSFFGGGNCDSSCYDCFGQSMCSSSQNNCSWISDPMGFGPGWCDPASLASFWNCTTNAQSCMGQTACQGAGHNWTSSYVTDSFSGQSMPVCIANGTTPEICFVYGDEDNDGTTDCADSDCSQDPMCGFGMGATSGSGGAGGGGGGMMLPPGMEMTLCFAYDDTNQSACEATIIDSALSFNGSHRGDANLPAHLNNTQVCFYHAAPPGASETNWCDPIFDQQMTGDMDMGKPPTPIGDDNSGDADGLTYLDIVHVGIMDDPQNMNLGIPMTNMTTYALCNDKLGGTLNGTIYRYIDTDSNTSNGCTAANGTYDGFDYKLVISATYNGSSATTITAAYRCVDATNNIWTTKSASLTVMSDGCFASPPPGGMPGMGTFNGVSILTFGKSDFGIATNDLRILVSTVGPGYNETNVTDEAGPFYYTPGAIDFKMEDCFGFVDMDGDGFTPDKDPDCKFINNLGYIPFEDCGDNIDNNGDNLVDCNDPMCAFTPLCSGGTFNFSSSSSDTTSPSVIFHKAETSHDGAYIKFDTNEPANGTIFFYNTDSGCTQVNKTIIDIGDPSCSGTWCGYDDYKLWHDAPIDNDPSNTYRLNFDLSNATTYYYKYKVCDPNNNCATSKCSNFTTENSVKSFYFDMTPPSGATIITPWASGGQTYAQQVNTSQTKDINITVECSTSGYSLKLVGVDIKSATDIDFSDFICTTSSNVVGMPSDKWNQMLFNLGVNWVEITWATSGTGATIYHCDEDGTSNCVDVTTYLDCTSNSSSLTCKIPTTLGFSTYKVTTPSTSSSSGGGGGGGSKAQCNNNKDDDSDGLIDYPNDPGCASEKDTNETDVPSCTQSWSCTTWSECTNDLETRACSDDNDCLAKKAAGEVKTVVELSKPLETRDCSIVQETAAPEPAPETPPASSGGITGAAIAEPTPIDMEKYGLIGLAVLGGLAIVFALVQMRKPKVRFH